MRSRQLLLTGALLLVLASAKTWTEATDMRADVERLVLKRAKYLQTQYEGVKQAEGATCTYVKSCDPQRTKNPAAWTAAGTSPAAFLTAANDPADPSTCFRRDRDEQNQYIEPVTGRFLCDSVRGGVPDCADINCGSWPGVTYDATTKSYIKNNADGLLGAQTSGVGQGRYFLNNGCTYNSTSDDNGKCFVNMNEYGINLPDDVSISQLQATTGQVQAEICVTNKLVKSYKENHENYPQLAWSFLGMQKSGLYRNWPLIYQCRTEAQCDGCSDPRFRSWFADAASLPKDVIIVVDSSGSMSNVVAGSSGKTRMQVAKEAVKLVINTLSWVDYAMVVTFSSTAETVGSTGSELMVAMTLEGRSLLKKYIDEIGEPMGNTRADLGITKAFDTLAASKAAGRTSNCSSVIVYMADGANTGTGNPVDIIKARNQASSVHTRLFTYNFLAGSSAAAAEMKSMACESQGVYRNVDTQLALKRAMASYFSFLAIGLVPKDGSDQAVRWVEPYEDGQGIGQNTAACAPVYDTSASPWDLFAVVCSAIKDGDLVQLSGWGTEWDSIKDASHQCPSHILSEEQLQQIRSNVSPDSICGSDNSDAPLGIIIAVSVCGLVVVVAALGVLFWLSCRKAKDQSMTSVVPVKETNTEVKMISPDCNLRQSEATQIIVTSGVPKQSETTISQQPSWFGTGQQQSVVPYVVKKRHAAFLSHYKAECAMEARFLHSELGKALATDKIFIDSDNLHDLRVLLEDVEHSDHLLLVLSKGLLTRPWCLLEVFAAIEAKIPIVTVYVRGSAPYDFADGVHLLTHLDTLLEERNPGAAILLTQNNVDLLDCAWKLSTIVPHLISIEFNPSGSKNQIAASIHDIIEGMGRATPADDPSFYEPDARNNWLSNRPPIERD